MGTLSVMGMMQGMVMEIEPDWAGLEIELMGWVVPVGEERVKEAWGKVGWVVGMGTQGESMSHFQCTHHLLHQWSH